MSDLKAGQLVHLCIYRIYIYLKYEQNCLKINFLYRDKFILKIKQLLLLLILDVYT